jgi:hypothetical protein
VENTRLAGEVSTLTRRNAKLMSSLQKIQAAAAEAAE